MNNKQTRRHFLGSVIAAASAGAVVYPEKQTIRAQDTSHIAGDLGTIFPPPKYSRIDTGIMTELPSDQPVTVGDTMKFIEFRWAYSPLMGALEIKSSVFENVVKGVQKNAQLPPVSYLVGSPDDHKELGQLYNRLKSRLPKGLGNGLGEEGYLLSTGPNGVRVVANTASGVFYGIQTLLQLLAGSKAVPQAEVADVPVMGFRGTHFGFNNPDDIPLLKSYIREELPRRKANTLVLSVNYAFKFKSHPEINEATMLDESNARDLARHCKNNNIHLIPLINCFGHQSWRPDSIRGLLRAYPQFNETPCMTGEDVLMYNWCPSDPRIAPIAFELIDELIEAFETDTVHLGMDEVLYLGVCPFCRKKSPAELFAKVVNEFHDHVVARRNVKMMIWGDRLVDGFKTPYNPMNGSRNGTHPAINMVPKDILLCDWHYHLHESYPSVDQFENAGFDYVICGWRKLDAIRAFIEYASAHGKEHFKGYLHTNWGGQIPMMHYMTEGTLEVEDAEEIKNFTACNRLGLELAWTGIKK